MKGMFFISVFLFFGLFAKGQMECRSLNYRKNQLSHSPDIAIEVKAIESFTKSLKLSQANRIDDLDPAGKGFSQITIPVVVHVLYNAAQQNISDDQVRSQLDVLNRDYGRENADTVRTPEIFRQFGAGCGIHFELAKTDPFGYATSGIVHKYTSILAFNIEDGIKFSKSGGDEAWNSDNYLNIWEGSLENGVLGYSSVVGGHKENDGIVVQYTAFGTQGTARAPFDRGRTSTHELGHWLNLLHVWGDTDCGDDLVDDTPPQRAPHRGCPANMEITCGHGPFGDMYMNYMDFTDDACMNIFTAGQRDRMRTLFAAGGPRYNLLSSTALTAIPKPGSDHSNSTGDGGINSLQIFPNPAGSIISVEIPSSIRLGSTLEIIDGLGKKLFTGSLNSRQQQLSIAFLRSGIYYLAIQDGSKRKSAKLVKM